MKENTDTLIESNVLMILNPLSWFIIFIIKKIINKEIKINKMQQTAKR